MKAFVVVSMGGRLVYLYPGDDLHERIFGLMRGRDTGFFERFAQKVLADTPMPMPGKVHIVCLLGNTKVLGHGEFLALLAKAGETWEEPTEPIPAGPEADAMNESDFTTVQHLVAGEAAMRGNCATCPVPGYECITRQKPFSRAAFDAAVTEMENDLQNIQSGGDQPDDPDDHLN